MSTTPKFTSKSTALVSAVVMVVAGLVIGGTSPVNAATATYDFDSKTPTSSGMYDSGTNSVGSPVVAHDGKAMNVVRGSTCYSGFDVIKNAGSKLFDSTNKSVTFDVYNGQSGNRQILVKAEGGGADAQQVLVTAIPGWSTVTATLPSAPDTGFAQMDFFPGFSCDLGDAAQYGAAGETYAFDNIVIPEVTSVVTPPSTSAATFDMESDAGTPPFKAVYDGGLPSVTTSIGGRTDKALKVTRGGACYSGFNIVDPSGNLQVTKAGNPAVVFDVYNSQSGPRQILVKLEGDPTNLQYAIQLFTTAPAGWSTQVVDFSSLGAAWSDHTFTQLDLFPGFSCDLGDANAYGANGDVFYFDNLKFNQAVVNPTPTPVVKVAQTIGAVATSVKVGKTITLPAKTSKALTIKWTTSTSKICSIAAGKVKGLKVGTCRISGTNAGSSTVKPVTKAVTISVKK